MSTSTNCFEEYASFACIQFVHDTDANTLVVEDVGKANLNKFVPLIKRYAFQRKIAKISIKVKEANAICFFQHGFKVEASILAFYGVQDAFYIAYYLQESYLENQFSEKHNAILDASFNINNKKPLDLNDNNIKVSCGLTNSTLDSKQPLIFSGRKAIHRTQNANNKFCAQIDNKILASVNADYCKNKNVVAFSQFTVNVDLEPQNVFNRLLTEMSNYYALLDCQTAYTTVPASSLMINTLCVDNDFEFGGRLTNESVFKGKLDSLNTWFKRL